MDLSNPQRLFKLARTLVRHPLHFPDYCRYHLYRGKRPIDLGLPWWSFAAIEAVQEFCAPAHEVFEYGSGGSTIFLARRCRRVTAVEDDADWCARMRSELDRAELRNATLQHAAFDFQKPVGFGQSEYLHTLDRPYDLIVVDGQDWTYDVRPACFARAEQFIRPGGVIVVDDSWRYRQLRTANRAQRVQTCEGVGPCRVGVTSTDLYYY